MFDLGLGWLQISLLFSFGLTLLPAALGGNKTHTWLPPGCRGGAGEEPGQAEPRRHCSHCSALLWQQHRWLKMASMSSSVVLSEPCTVTGEQRLPLASWALRPPHAHPPSGSNARKKTSACRGSCGGARALCI